MDKGGGGAHTSPDHYNEDDERDENDHNDDSTKAKPLPTRTSPHVSEMAEGSLAEPVLIEGAGHGLEVARARQHFSALL